MADLTEGIPLSVSEEIPFTEHMLRPGGEIKAVWDCLSDFHNCKEQLLGHVDGVEVDWIQFVILNPRIALSIAFVLLVLAIGTCAAVARLVHHAIPHLDDADAEYYTGHVLGFRYARAVIGFKKGMDRAIVRTDEKVIEAAFAQEDKEAKAKARKEKSLFKLLGGDHARVQQKKTYDPTRPPVFGTGSATTRRHAM